jgi:hypothetical protein
VLDENIDSHRVLIALLVNVAYNLALLSANSRQKKKVLQVFVVAEW